MKVCTKCKKNKNFSSFYADNRKRDGLQSHCKECFKKRTAEYAKNNRIKSNCWKRKYARSNEGQKKKKEYMKKNKENFDAYRKKWQDKNLKKMMKENPKKFAARSLFAQAIKKGSIVRASNCSKCGVDGMICGHHYDYDKPLDVIWLCKKCHNRLHKSKYTYEE